MSKQDILEIIRQTRPELTTRFGVERLGLFGSYVRQTGTAAQRH